MKNQSKTNKIQQKNNKNRTAQRISVVIITTILLFVLATIFSGCRAAKSITASEVHDSTRVEYRFVHDTIIQHDTIYVEHKTERTTETDSGTKIHYGAGGGTYNTQTGEATNVSSVETKETKRETELSKIVATLTSENATLHHTLDSIAEQNTNETHHDETEPVKMNWWERFFYISGIVAWCVLIVLVIWWVVKLLRKYKVIP